MNKLMSAQFSRLLKDKGFWLGMIVMGGFGLLLCITRYTEMIKYNVPSSTDEIFFTYTMMNAFVSSAFCSVFLGTEYSDGTVRNKLMIGHSRRDVYLVNLIVCTAASLLMSLAYLAVICAVGFPLLGLPRAGVQLILLCLLDSVLTCCALCALFTMVSMLNQNKTAAVVICIFGTLLILLASTYIASRLDAPQYIDSYLMDGSGGGDVERIPNPQYLLPEIRPIYQTLLYLLPGGQIYLIAGMTVQGIWQIPVFAAAIAIVATVIGIVGFRRKDIK